MCRHSKKIVDYDPRFESVLCDIGLYQLRDALRLTPDLELITALVERWRLETNTFHLYHGEATITLEDMHFITGLAVDGLGVTSTTLILTEAKNLCDYVQNLLGKRLATSDLSLGRIKMTWLRTNFTYREGDDIETIHQYCRAYILVFFGSCIFADRLGAYAHLFFLPLLEDLNRVGEYAWGAAALSWLYKELGRTAFRIESGTTGDHIGDNGGWVAVVQVWALEKRTWTPEGRSVPRMQL
ncbi:Serine/threonine-protein phosphatase 7 long form homolog [Linum perenne]